jgi:hypothetical protein
MSVQNVRVINIRPEYSNLKKWRQDKNNCYIGRAGVVFIEGERYPKKASIWQNPYKISATMTRTDVLRKYKKYIKAKIIDEDLGDELEKLRGKNLGCWCHPEPCHGDVLLKLLKANKSK